MVEQPLTLHPVSEFHLRDFEPGYTGAYSTAKEAKEQTKENRKRLTELQEMLYAQGKYALLIVLQGMDTAGKDGTIKHVMGAFNPQGGCRCGRSRCLLERSRPTITCRVCTR